MYKIEDMFYYFKYANANRRHYAEVQRNKKSCRGLCLYVNFELIPTETF